MKNIHNIKLSTDGVGIVIYSNKAMENICEGYDFFANEFSSSEKASYHIRKGDITGFCTGSSGDYNISIFEGYPDEKYNLMYPISIRLALNVVGTTISIIDLAWLMEWSDDVPNNQQIIIDEGVYHLTILTKKPASGFWGDDQDICIFLNKINDMPNLEWHNIPRLYKD